MVSRCELRAVGVRERIVVERILGGSGVATYDDHDPDVTDVIAVGLGRILGSAQLVRVCEPPREGYWIYGLYVFPAWRRCGLGRRLVAHLVSLAAGRGAGSVLLSVAEDNRAAVGLYESAGFRPYEPTGGLGEWLAATSDALGGRQLMMRRTIRA